MKSERLYKIIDDDTQRICDFLSKVQGTVAWSNCTAIGLERDGELIAGVVYDYFNGVNVCMHIAAIEGSRWMTKDFLHYIFYYAFVQMGCKRMTGIIPAHGNPAAYNFASKLKGVEIEGRMKDAHPLGDLVIFCLRAEDCTYLRIKDGKKQSTATA